jgi:hypothetical protein
VTNGSVTLGPDAEGDIPFGLLVVEAVEEKKEAKGWSIRVLHLEGPALTLEGSGAILPGGRLRVGLEIGAMNELVRTALAHRGLSTRPLPVELALRGTVRRPHLGAAPE